MKTTTLFSIALLSGGALFGASKLNIPAEPQPGEPLSAVMGQRKPVTIRVARNQATLIRLPENQRVMSVYGGDKGDGGLWGVDAGKVPTRYLAVKPKEKGIRTTLHVVSNTGQEISFYLTEVTGLEAIFDAEVDALDSKDSSGSTVLTDVKWVPADEAQTCKLHASTLTADLAASEKQSLAKLAAAQKEAEAKADALVHEYQQQYPRKLFFGYHWDQAKAQRLGLESIWSDDKFTYIKGTKVLALYEINEDGKPSLIQYSYANGVYTVPKLLYDGYFAIGTKKENKLTFHRERDRKS